MTLYVFILFIFICLSRCFKIYDRQALLQEIIGNGFHRTLRYSVAVQMHTMDNNCFFMIKQQIPVNFYVDMDELQNLKAFGGPNVNTESAIDTEGPSYKAMEHSISINPTIYEHHSAKMLFEVWLPIHVRYQRPMPSGNKVLLSIENAKLYSNCSTSFQAEDHSKDSCNGDHATGNDCKWRFVHEFAKAKEDNLVKIPTGNTDHAIVVTFQNLVIRISREQLHPISPSISGLVEESDGGGNVFEMLDQCFV